MNKSLNSSGITLFRFGLSIFLLVILVGYLDSKIMGDGAYIESSSVPLISPHGVDFRAVYDYGVALRGSMKEYLAILNIYPPFVTVAILPFTVFSVNTAYRLFAVFLACSLFLMLFVSLLEKKSLDNTYQRKFFLALVALAVLFQTYPVNFSFERGNSDIFAATFAVLSLFAITRRFFWLSVICLVVSTQFKVYPAILAGLLFWRLGLKALVSYGVLNIAALFVIGIPGVEKFISSLYGFASSPYCWIGNHSVYSYVHFLVQDGYIAASSELFVRNSLNVLFLGVFGGLLLYFFIKTRKYMGKFEGSYSGVELGIIGMAFCLMSLVPSIGHDYKLVVQLVPFAFILNRNWDELLSSKKQAYATVGVISLSVAFMFLPRMSTIPLRILGVVDSVTQMKTTALILAFCAYAFLTLKGKGVTGNNVSSI